MALLKEIKHNNGVVGVYHRIAGINKNYNKLIVDVESYADSTYRDKEKERITLSGQIGDLISKLSVVTGSPQTDETVREAKEIEEKLEYYNGLCAIKQYYAFKTSVELEYEEGDDISFEAIYEKLTNSDTDFANAETVE